MKKLIVAHLNTMTSYTSSFDYTNHVTPITVNCYVGSDVRHNVDLRLTIEDAERLIKDLSYFVSEKVKREYEEIKRR